ncbi:MAG: MFS transporter [Fimbriimonas sp.]|nr:MFS transporter [Fimbriimonas sp.]
MTIPNRPTTGFRWTICALIFLAVTVNYLDRQLFSVLTPFFEDDLKLGPTDIALLNVSFILPYGYAMLFVGRFIDRVGTRRGLSGAFVVWSIASVCHALVRGIGAFMGVRFVLGVGESGMYPSAVKTTTDWFPRHERATGIGIFNAGSNVGAILAPLIGVWIASSALGWRACFLITGTLGMVWLFLWLPTYRQPEKHPKVSPSELAYIRSDGQTDEPPLSFAQLFAMRQVYGLAIAKALSDAPIWFYLAWMPKILVDQFHVTPTFMAFSIPVIYVVADIGSIFGGWLSSRLLKAGWSLNRARKGPMLMFACLVAPVASVGFLVDHPPISGIPCVYWAVGLVALACGAHQGWSCNLFTTISDTVPQSSMALAVGAINGFAMVGVSAMQLFVGRCVQLTSSYTLPFIVSGSLYLIAFVVLQGLLPHIEPSLPTKLAKLPLVVAGGVILLIGLGAIQFEVNRPPYASIADYRSHRASELHAAPEFEIGPTAKVGWMEAQWYLWRPTKGKPKMELVKLDTHGQPFVESKGAKASKYAGPTEISVAGNFGIAPLTAPTRGN